MLDRIMIIDDHPSVVEGLKSMIEKSSIAKRIFTAFSYAEGLDKTFKEKPDLILMDISLKGSSGIELMREILIKLPETKIIMISMYSKINFIVESLKAGAKGYILKELSSEQIINGIKRVVAGEIFVDSLVSGSVINTLLNQNDKIPSYHKSYETLTLREQELLRLLCEGRTIKEISNNLSISANTVINHRTNIMQKLDCKNMIELIRYSVRLGLVDF
ncbi:MAG: response regulator transcription factor [Spirochaetaceae bacterium]|nr:response regulator transcription factor [Spirochaetaceae bacterium]